MRKIAAVLAVATTALTMASPPAKAAGSASGTIHLPSPAPSLVLSKMQSECNGTPETQGTDGFVMTIGPATRFSVSGTPAVPGTPVDLDVYFIDSECRATAWVLPGSFVTNAPVPAGTKYVLVDLSLGAEVTVRATWT